MAVNLVKGAKVNLTKDGSLKNVLIGLGWDVNTEANDITYDLDATCFLLNENGVCRSENDIIFYNNLKSPCGCVVHQGDNRDGSGSGDDEQIKINLEHLPADIHKIAMVVTIDDPQGRGLNFGRVENSYIRIVDTDTKEVNADGVEVPKELAKFELEYESSSSNAVIFGTLVKKNNNWIFCAEGKEYNDGLQGLLGMYGLS